MEQVQKQSYHYAFFSCEVTLGMGIKLLVHYGAGFLFVFKAQQQAHSGLCNCFCNAEDEQKDKSECTSNLIPIP